MCDIAQPLVILLAIAVGFLLPSIANRIGGK